MKSGQAAVTLDVSKQCQRLSKPAVSRALTKQNIHTGVECCGTLHHREKRQEIRQIDKRCRELSPSLSSDL